MGFRVGEWILRPGRWHIPVSMGRSLCFSWPSCCIYPVQWDCNLNTMFPPVLKATLEQCWTWGRQLRKAWSTATQTCDWHRRWRQSCEAKPYCWGLMLTPGRLYCCGLSGTAAYPPVHILFNRNILGESHPCTIHPFPLLPILRLTSPCNVIMKMGAAE